MNFQHGKKHQLSAVVLLISFFKKAQSPKLNFLLPLGENDPWEQQEGEFWLNSHLNTSETFMCLDYFYLLDKPMKVWAISWQFNSQLQRIKRLT